MKNFAIIENGLVVNVLVGETATQLQELTGLKAIELNESRTAGIGWSWDGKKFEDTRPVPAIPEDVVTEA